jgi:ABC-type transport system involved in multi-copper enzyme maturation permease subunit
MRGNKMNNLFNMIWIELRKAIRSRMPLWTTLGSLFMPLGMALLIFLARNPEISRRLGLVSAKANMIAYAATDWASYLVLFAEVISAGGFFFFILAISWVFGREFADGTLKDMLAVPVQRSSILLAKFIVVTAWSAVMAILILLFGLIMGVIIQLPGGSPSVILNGVIVAAITSCLVIMVVLPFALFASLGRGYMLPMAMAVLALIMANLVMAVGWGDYFPWAVPLLYVQGKSALTMTSYWIVIFTCLAGMISTYLWWKYADQNR